MRKLIFRIFHRHDWYSMTYDEWMKMGGYGRPDCVCTKCGELRWWCDTR